MKKLILIGTGGHAKACIDVIKEQKKYKIIGLVEKEIEELDKDYCFIHPEYDTIHWEHEKSEECYFNLGEHIRHLKKSLQTLNHKMAVFN